MANGGESVNAGCGWSRRELGKWKERQRAKIRWEKEKAALF